MQNHPANKPRSPLSSEPPSLGRAILAALEAGGDEVVNLYNVYALGCRVKRTQTKGGERAYHLEGFAHRPDMQPEARQRFYRLSGGASSAVTVLDRNGEPIAHGDRKGAGFSREFREWIARAVEADRERCGF